MAPAPECCCSTRSPRVTRRQVVNHELLDPVRAHLWSDMKQRNLSTGLVGIALTVACGGATRTSATGTAAPAPEMARDNPFAAARFYVNPEYAAKVEATIAAAPGQAERLRRVEAFPTAVWLNSIATSTRLWPCRNRGRNPS